MNYYTLVGIERDGIERFEILFGDFDKETVEDERAEYKEQGEYKSLKIVCTGESQREIDNKLCELNGEQPAAEDWMFERDCPHFDM